MNDIDALELVKEFYSENYKDSSIIVKLVTAGTLNDLLTTCDGTKHIEEVINYYDDEDNPGSYTWTDVEGEGYGWLWLKEENDESKWHGLIRNSLLDFINRKSLRLLDKCAVNVECFLLVTTGSTIIYHFTERENLMSDIIYTFSDDEIIY